MNPLKKVIELKEREARAIPISGDSYQLWRENECTQRLMIELDLLALYAYEDTTTKLDGLRSAVVGIYEQISEWKPVELENE